MPRSFLYPLSASLELALFNGIQASFQTCFSLSCTKKMSSPACSPTPFPSPLLRTHPNPLPGNGLTAISIRDRLHNADPKRIPQTDAASLSSF